MTDPVFRSYQEALALSEQDISMASTGKLPAKQGGAKVTPNHAPHSGTGTTNGVGDGKGGKTYQGSVHPKGTGKNKNRLH